ncbi:substrate-binding periplasmic protein [Thalassolituus sp. LLYu03]|uniref:substrate-binding periplasmic protein n=1 Tax=Thalassolituus sp. LLYu03 TaxID=3421656 RepID=UPI003D2CA3A7
MLTRHNRLLILLFAGCLTAPPTLADDTPSVARVTTSTVTPWGIVHDNAPMTGMLVDFQKTLFERAGVPYTNRPEPYPRVIQSIAGGSADVAVMFVSPAADQIGENLGNIAEERIVVVTTATAREVTSLNDFAGKLVGHVRGSKYGPVFDQHNGIVRTPVTDVEQGLKMLLSGRLAAMASTEHSLLYAMYTAGIDSRQVRIALPLFNVKAGLYVSHAAAHEPWVAPLRQALKTMIDDGSVKAALYQHDYWPYATFCFAGGQCLNSR